MEYDSMVNSSDVAIILSVHNKLRRQIAKGLDLEGQSSGLPKASNMNELVGPCTVVKTLLTNYVDLNEFLFRLWFT